MGKGRMTVLDVAAVVKELRKRLIGARLANSTFASLVPVGHWDEPTRGTDCVMCVCIYV
jgi:hypothetical protein